MTCLRIEAFKQGEGPKSAFWTFRAFTKWYRTTESIIGNWYSSSLKDWNTEQCYIIVSNVTIYIYSFKHRTLWNPILVLQRLTAHITKSRMDLNEQS